MRLILKTGLQECENTCCNAQDFVLFIAISGATDYRAVAIQHVLLKLYHVILEVGVLACVHLTHADFTSLTQHF